MARDLKYGQFDIPGVGEDEPIFIIRARDVLAMPIIEHYTLMAEEAGVDTDILEGLDNASEQIFLWQQANGSRVPS